ncbi:Tobamovirus multiplication protein 1 [Morella rubra]|uniref:Tobamovirus multiplication protein 1 n=1 Tax=Morella rubra TaxID=262757 RepID=A0A6A1W801_9ROSI|nr:Tobamovirus multiplication protein 1 [Morella rubra]
MLELRDGCSFPRLLVGVTVVLALVDAIIAVLAFYQTLMRLGKLPFEGGKRIRGIVPLQLAVAISVDRVLKHVVSFLVFQLRRIHLRNSQLAWTRQKVFHLMIGSSNMGEFIYFVLALAATCRDWPCWSNSCGFILMAIPKILFFAVFLLLLSFWVDLCHQANEEEDEYEESSYEEALLDKSLNKPGSSNTDGRRKCFPVRFGHLGSRQKIAILVTVLVFLAMVACALIMWIGIGNNPIDSAVVARVYVDFFSVAVLLLGGALACYGLLLCLKISKVRSERASSEMWKFAGLAVVSVFCFTSSSVVALLTDIPYLLELLASFAGDSVCSGAMKLFMDEKIVTWFLMAQLCSGKTYTNNSEHPAESDLALF